MKIKKLKEKYSKYIPSKKFGIIITVCLVLILVPIVFYSISAKEKFNAKNAAVLETGQMTINDLVQKDTDGDGIPDWEEALWGTDKNNKATFNGVPDATYIANKKKELGTDQTPTDQNLTETEKFSREFFTAFTAMKQSGTVDSTTINNFSNALGQKMIDPSLIDRFNPDDIKLSSVDNTSEQKKYYASMKKLFDNYQSAGIGDELDIVSNDLSIYSTLGTGVQSAELQTIADAYQEFAVKSMDLSVPKSLMQYHLQIANSANNTGISVRNMARTIEDPIVGLSGLSQYQKYSGELISAVADMEAVMP